MGIIAIRHEDPVGHYCCMYCNTPIAHMFDMEKFKAITHSGNFCFVFKKIFNISKSFSNSKIFLNGHEKLSKDVCCIKCNNYLGYQTDEKSYLFKSKLI